MTNDESNEFRGRLPRPVSGREVGEKHGEDLSPLHGLSATKLEGTKLPDFNPRTNAVLNSGFAEFRLASLALSLERELAVQTDLARHWKVEAARLNRC